MPASKAPDGRHECMTLRASKIINILISELRLAGISQTTLTYILGLLQIFLRPLQALVTVFKASGNLPSNHEGTS